MTQAGPTQSSDASAAPPSVVAPAPREVTPAASRRAWHEPRVHFWWIVAIGLLAGAAFLAGQQLVAWRADVWLIRNGTKLDAVVWPAGARVKGRPIEKDDYAHIEFTWKGELRQLTWQRWTRQQGAITGETVPIYVDPDDPENWTANITPPPLAKSLIGAASLVGVAIVLLLISVARRKGVLGVWRDGEARLAAVVERTPAALAPRSWLVRCALAEGNDRRLITVYIPRRLATPQKGELLWLIMPPGKPDKAIAAMSFS
jgi:hypothetical protein